VSDIAAVYLDDVIIHATTEQEAVARLERVLRVLQEAGLTLNPAKCTFMATWVTFLGFEIENGRVQPGTSKLTAVNDFPRPTTVRNIRQFLGLTGYFRHFVRGYSLIARPLTQLLKRDNGWHWGEEEEKAFLQLKQQLVSGPILCLYLPGAETEVHTDASSIGLAGMIMQRQEDGRMHPIAYYSRKTTGAEPNYHSYELELLAVVETVCKY